MKKKRQNKLVSLITTGLLILNQIGVTPALWAAPPSEVKIPSPAFQLNLPPELGTIQSLHSGSGPTLVHIQTAHGNYEAQKKIQAILHYLKDTYGFKLLLLEGSASKLNPDLLRFFPERMDLTMKMAEELTKEALVKGDELFLLEEPKAEAYGIEDIATYRKTREAFKAVILQKEKTEKFLQDMDLQIERLTGPYLNKRLRSFLKRLEAFESKTLPLLDWLAYLKTQAKETLNLDLTDPLNQFDWPMILRIYKLREFESKIDLNAFAKERDQFFTEIAPSLREAKRRSNLHPGTASASSGTPPHNEFEEIKTLLSSPLSQNQLPDPETGLLFERMVEALPENFNYDAFPHVKLFIGHLILQSEVKGERLMEEMSRMTDQIQEKLAKTEEEKKILSLLKDYRLLERLFALELTPEDYENLLNRGKSARPSNVIHHFLALNDGKRVRNLNFSHLEEIDSLFEKALEFYQGVKERDSLMLQNIEIRLKETKAKKAVIITGGFHAEPFRHFFETQSFNYALIVPKITTTEGRETYLQAALQNSANLLKKSTMDLPRRMELPRVQISLGDDFRWIRQRMKLARLRIIKQTKEPIKEKVGPIRAEVRTSESGEALESGWGIPPVKDLKTILEKEGVELLSPRIGELPFAFLLHTAPERKDYIEKILRKDPIPEETRAEWAKGMRGIVLQASDLAQTASELGWDVARFLQQMGLPTDSNKVIAVSRHVDTHRSLFEETVHILARDTPEPLYFWQREVVNDFLQILFFPKNQLHRFKSTYTSWSESDKLTLQKQYLEDTGFNPNTQLRLILEKLLSDFEKDEEVEVGGEKLTDLFYSQALIEVGSSYDYKEPQTSSFRSRLRRKTVEYLRGLLAIERFSRYQPLFPNWTLGGGDALSGRAEVRAEIVGPPVDGSLSQEDRVHRLIDEIRTEWATIVRQGAFVFDVDKTLLPKGKRISDDPKLLQLLTEFLKAGIQVAIISAASWPRNQDRIHEPLRQGLGGEARFLQNLTMYTDGGATKYGFGVDGSPEEDSGYNLQHFIPMDQVNRFADAISRYAADKFHLLGVSPEVVEHWIRKRQTQWGKIDFDDRWREKSSWHIEPIEDRDLLRLQKEGGKTTFPFFELRGIRYGPGREIKGVASFTVAGFYSTEKFDVRDGLIEQLKKDLADISPLTELRKGGESSIDVTSVDADKVTALADFISSKKVNPKLLFYLGDEFYLGGNDQPIAEHFPFTKMGIRTLALNEKIPPPSPQTIWIGRSPGATQELLERSLTAVARIEVYPDPINAIEKARVTLNAHGLQTSEYQNASDVLRAVALSKEQTFARQAIGVLESILKKWGFDSQGIDPVQDPLGAATMGSESYVDRIVFEPSINTLRDLVLFGEEPVARDALEAFERVLKQNALDSWVESSLTNALHDIAASEKHPYARRISEIFATRILVLREVLETEDPDLNPLYHRPLASLLLLIERQPALVTREVIAALEKVLIKGKGRILQPDEVSVALRTIITSAAKEDLSRQAMEVFLRILTTPEPPLRGGLLHRSAAKALAEIVVSEQVPFAKEAMESIERLVKTKGISSDAQYYLVYNLREIILSANEPLAKEAMEALIRIAATALDYQARTSVNGILQDIVFSERAKLFALKVEDSGLEENQKKLLLTPYADAHAVRELKENPFIKDLSLSSKQFVKMWMVWRISEGTSPDQVRTELLEQILPGLKALEAFEDLPTQGAEFSLDPDSPKNPWRTAQANFFTQVGLTTQLRPSEGTEIRVLPAKIPIFYLILLMHLRLDLIDPGTQLALTVEDTLDKETLFLLTPLLFGKGLIPGGVRFDTPLPGDVISVASAYQSYIGQTLGPDGKILPDKSQTYFSLLAPLWISYVVEKVKERNPQSDLTPELLFTSNLRFQLEWLTYGSLAAFHLLGKKAGIAGIQELYEKKIKPSFFQFYTDLKVETGEPLFTPEELGFLMGQKDVFDRSTGSTPYKLDQGKVGPVLEKLRGHFLKHVGPSDDPQSLMAYQKLAEDSLSLLRKVYYQAHPTAEKLFEETFLKGAPTSPPSRAEVREAKENVTGKGPRSLAPEEGVLVKILGGLFPLPMLTKYGRVFLTAALITLGFVQPSLPAEAASTIAPQPLGSTLVGSQGPLNFTLERVAAAKRFLGIKADSQVQEAYLLGADLALNEGGLALIDTLFKDSVVAIVARHPEEFRRLAEYNQERIAKGKPRVLIVKTLRRAEQVLTQKLQGKGIVYGFASPREVSSEWIRILKQNFQVMNQARLQSFAETFGIFSLVEEFKARFQIQRSA